MKRMSGPLAMVAIAVLIAGCGGTKTIKLEQHKADDVQPPTWWVKAPQDDDFIYATATTTSQDLQLSVDKATIQCRAELAEQLDVKLRAIASRFDEETGFQKDAALKTAYKSAVNTRAETTLTGSRIKDKHVVRDGEMWRAYVLMELPLEGVHDAVIEGIDSDEALKDKLALTDTYKEIGG